MRCDFTGLQIKERDGGCEGHRALCARALRPAGAGERQEECRLWQVHPQHDGGHFLR